MVDSDQDQKTEEPTSKRLEEAREEGNIPVSRELATWFSFVGALIVITWIGPVLGHKFQMALRVFLEKPDQISLEDGGLQNVLMGVVATIAFPAVMVFGIFLFMAVVGTLIQTDFYMSAASLKFDFKRVLPTSGLSNLFSMNSLSELAKSFVKIVIIGYMGYKLLYPSIMNSPSFIERDLLNSMAEMQDRAVHIIVMLMLVITVIAVADALYVRFRFIKGLRMTKQEVKDEHKQMEGDPMIKARLRQIRMEKARRRMMAQVPKASVVVTNPTHYSVALQYDGTKMMAPVVVAKGIDKVAMRIREVAEENDVPMVSNPPLSRVLYDTIDVDQPITPEHYRAVAEVISYVYKLKNKKV